MKNNRDHPYSPEQVSPLNCICCGKEIEILYPNEKDSFLKLSSEMWNGGIVQEISAGFGSDKDGDVYLIAICDNCLSIKRNEGSAIYLYDYMNSRYDEENRKKYNVKLHRRMKLKRILNG